MHRFYCIPTVSYTMLDVSETAMIQAFDGGGFSVPYEIDGNLFFN